jgi:hypothetical protein
MACSIQVLFGRWTRPQYQERLGVLNVGRCCIDDRKQDFPPGGNWQGSVTGHLLRDGGNTRVPRMLVRLEQHDAFNNLTVLGPLWLRRHWIVQKPRPSESGIPDPRGWFLTSSHLLRADICASGMSMSAAEWNRNSPDATCWHLHIYSPSLLLLLSAPARHMRRWTRGPSRNIHSFGAVFTSLV